MRTNGPLKLVVAACAAAIAVPALAAQPALAAPKARVPITMNTQPAAITTDTTATFSWTSSAPGATFTCSLDGATALTCANTITYSGLSDGVHTFVLRAKKIAGYRPNTKSISWEVDSLPPGMPTVAPVPSPTKSTSANISFTNSDPKAVSHTCSLDGVAEVTCSSPYAVTGLLDGSHTVAVRAVDTNGNKSAPAEVSWVVDATAPENVQLVGPASPSNDATPDVSFSAVGATSYSCSVDGATAVSCSSPYTVPGPLTEGAHSITVNASDAVGNVAQPDTAVWDVDLTAPGQPTIVTGPAAVTNQTVADFILGNVDSSGTLQCKFDNAATWTACPSPLHYSGLSTGSHSLQIRSHDLAGNSSDVTSFSWTVDLTAPAPAVFTDGPSSPSKDTTPGFAWVETDPSTASFDCALDPVDPTDSSSYAACEGDWTWPPLTDGVHQLYVRALDATTPVPNASSPVVWTWEVDLTAPQAPNFSTTPPASTTDTTALFSFASDPGTSFTCSLDGATAVNCANPVTFNGLAEGSHTFTVVAEDAAHNASQSTYDWTIVAD